MKHLIVYSGLKNEIRNERVAFVFDFDGTLAPIRRNPDAAHISKETARLLHKLSERSPVFVLSARKREYLEREIPQKKIKKIGEYGMAGRTLSATKLFNLLQKIVRNYKGAFIERKRFSLVVHYRKLNKSRQEKFVKKIFKICRSFKKLNLQKGKKVIEIFSGEVGDKGKIIKKISKQYFPICFGDDVSDEKMFKSNPGISIRVGYSPSSNADYFVSNLFEMKKALRAFLRALCERPS